MILETKIIKYQHVIFFLLIIFKQYKSILQADMQTHALIQSTIN